MITLQPFLGDSSLASFQLKASDTVMSESFQLPNSPTLVIDGSGTHFFAGILDKDLNWLSLETASEPPLESLFATVDKVLAAAELKLESIQKYIYCEGPGSVLGLRLCAMALETWRRLNPNDTQLAAFNSLQLAAICLLNQTNASENALLISDWKKDAWNSLEIRNGVIGDVQPIATSDVKTWSGLLFHLPARKGWQAAPSNSVKVSYDGKHLPRLIQQPGLLKKTSEVTLYNTGANTFQKWTPQRHRAEIS